MEPPSRTDERLGAAEELRTALDSEWREGVLTLRLDEWLLERLLEPLYELWLDEELLLERLPLNELPLELRLLPMELLWLPPPRLPPPPPPPGR